MSTVSRRIVLFMLPALLAAAGCAVFKPPVAEREIVPPAEREFRGIWVATVANIDWPSEPGLSTALQQQEMTAILDTARALNLNAIVLQVRPQCDALYPSELEPWSYYLTGEQGKAPDPYYDPLAMWIEEAHARGMELHVWFNPYRAHHPIGGEVTATSVVRTRPEIVLELKDGYWWLDPALKGTQDYTLAVMKDVLTRYDIDGMHFDDYFYPYPSYNGNEDFPDDVSWQAYRDDGGKKSREDWRRENVDTFIRQLYKTIRKHDDHVKFGISPFGIWRPGYPSSIQGLDQYNVLFADAKRWLNEGWVDYFTPQLYWPIRQIPQSYPVLLGWWTEQNDKGRNLWPGLYTSRVLDEAGVAENLNQIMVTRGFVPAGPGNIHFSVKAMLADSTGLNEALHAGPYSKPALVPPSSWLDDDPPDAPIVSAAVSGDMVNVSWQPEGDEPAFRWVVYWKRGNRWDYDIVSADTRTYRIPLDVIPAGAPEDTPPERVTWVCVSSVDRTGNESERRAVPAP